jgi:hypothetical protein
MTRVVRLDLASSLSTSERLDAAFARAQELDDGSSPDVAGTVEFPLRGDGSVLMRLDRAELFLHDQATAAVASDELAALRQWMVLHRDEVVRWRGSVRRKPLNPGESRWSATTRTRGVTDRPRTVVIDGREVTIPAGAPVSRGTVRWGRTQGTLPPSEADRPSG